MAIVKVVPMPGPSGDGSSGNTDLGYLTITSSTDPLEGDLTVLEAPGTITIQSPTAPGLINVQSYLGLHVSSHSSGGIYVNGTDQNHKVVTFGDLSTVTATSVRWTPNFTATGLTFTGSGTSHPTYNSYYVKQGQLVSFWIAIDCATVTSFGTGQLKVDLPIAPLPGTMNHFSGWVNVDEAVNPDLAGHIIVNADHLPNVQTIDLHYIKSAGGANSAVMEAQLIQGTPVTLTTATNIYINGTYIAE